MNPASHRTHPCLLPPGLRPESAPPRDAKARSSACRLSAPAAAPGTSLPRRSARVLAPAAVKAVALALFTEDTKSLEGTRMHGCAEQLRKLGQTLKRPLAPAIVRGMADRVVDTLAQGKLNDLGLLVEVLAEVMGGAAIEADTLRIASARLLDAGPRLTAQNLETALLTLCRSVGGLAMSAAHRQALLDAAIDALEPLSLAHGFAPNDPAHRPSARSDALLRAMTSPALGTGCVQAHLDAIVQRIVAPGAPGSMLARASLLESLSGALSLWHHPGCQGPAYIALLRRAPAFDTALYDYAASCFNFADLLSDDPSPECESARLRTFAADMARWATSLEPVAMRALMAGTAHGVWSDTALTAPRFDALVRGLLDAAGTDETLPLEGLARGLLQTITQHKVLQPEHVESLLSIASEPPLSGQVGKQHALVKALCEALSDGNWPTSSVMALADGLIAGAARAPAMGRYAAGAYLGHCLSDMEPGARLFAQVLGRLVSEPALDAACELVAGFFTRAGTRPDNGQEFEAITAALLQGASRDPVRAAAVAAQFALTLGAHREPPGKAGGWAQHFRSAQEGKAAPSSAGSHVPHPLAHGLDLAINPVQAVRRAGGAASLQLERLDGACQVVGIFNAERLHQQVVQLQAMDFGADHELRADMLLALFQHHARLAKPATFTIARNLIVEDLQRAPDTPSAATAPARLDGTGPATVHLSPRGHLVTLLEALYRDYVTASSPLDPPPALLKQRLAWLEPTLDAMGPATTWERRLVRGLGEDYRYWLPSDDPPAPDIPSADVPG